MSTYAPEPAPAPIQAEEVSDLAVVPAPSGEQSTIRRILDGISDACCELDRRLAGHRWHAVFVVSVVGMLFGVSRLFDGWPTWPYAALLGIFVLLLAMLAWARIAGIRFEAADKGWATAIRGGLAGLLELCRSDDGDEADDELPDSQRKAGQRRLWMQRLFSASVLFYMPAGLIGLFPTLAAGAGVVQAVAVLTSVVSFLLWMRGRWDDEQTGQVRKFATHSTEATEAEFLSLPPVLELKKSNVEEIAIAQRSSDELLRELLNQLPKWRPGKRDHESAYQAALVKFLRKRFPGVLIDEQVPVTPDSSRGQASRLGRIDLVLDRRIAIELKRLGEKKELDRCIGQMQNYADLWRDRGLLFLLVCESEPDFTNSSKAERLAAAQHASTPFRVLIGGYRRA